jgi:hypothetical protein
LKNVVAFFTERVGEGFLFSAPLFSFDFSTLKLKSVCLFSPIAANFVSFRGFFVGFTLLGLIRFAVIRILRPLFFQLVAPTAARDVLRVERNKLRCASLR